VVVVVVVVIVVVVGGGGGAAAAAAILPPKVMHIVYVCISNSFPYINTKLQNMTAVYAN